jgi:predicted TPR repeat methyltransferase
MTSPRPSPSSTEFFDAMYADDEDPWAFATSPYERGRYRDLLHLLGPGPFPRAFEPGCSIGVLTDELAPRCGALLAMDASSRAVDHARRRCGGHPGVELRVGRLPEDLPVGPFDLIVFSEVGYYFPAPVLAALLDGLTARLEPGGLLAGTHWTGRSADHVQSGTAVHDLLDRTAGLRRRQRTVRPGYELGAWVRV